MTVVRQAMRDTGRNNRICAIEYGREKSDERIKGRDHSAYFIDRRKGREG